MTKKEINTLETIMDKLNKFQEIFEYNDYELNYGNGTIYEQIGCAIAALETIYQEI